MASINLAQSKPKTDAPSIGKNLSNAHLTTGNSDGSGSSFQSLLRWGVSHGRGGRGQAGDILAKSSQVCFKFGHTASTCYRRFNQKLQAPITADYHGNPQGLSQGYQGYFSQTASTCYHRFNQQFHAPITVDYHGNPSRFFTRISMLFLSSTFSISWLSNSLELSPNLAYL